MLYLIFDPSYKVRFAALWEISIDDDEFTVTKKQDAYRIACEWRNTGLESALEELDSMCQEFII